MKKTYILLVILSILVVSCTNLNKPKDSALSKFKDELRKNNQNLAVSKQHISLFHGDSGLLGLVIFNNKSEILNYSIVITAINYDNLSATSNSANWFQYSQYSGEFKYKVNPNDLESREIRISIPDNAKNGEYKFILIIYDLDTNQTFSEQNLSILITDDENARNQYIKLDKLSIISNKYWRELFRLPSD